MQTFKVRDPEEEAYRRTPVYASALVPGERLRFPANGKYLKTDFKTLSTRHLKGIMKYLMEEAVLPGPGDPFYHELERRKIVNEKTFNKHIKVGPENHELRKVFKNLGIRRHSHLREAAIECFNRSYYLALHKETPLSIMDSGLAVIDEYIKDSNLVKKHLAKTKMPEKEAREQVFKALRYAFQEGLKYFLGELEAAQECIAIKAPAYCYLTPFLKEYRGKMPAIGRSGSPGKPL